MTKKKVFSEILNKIKQEEITPTPKWQCRLINGSFWLAVVVMVALSSVFFSLILINIFEVPLEIFHYMKIGRYLKVVFGIFPFAWLFLVLVSLFLGLVAFNKTKHGYRYNFVLLVSILLTIVLMSGFILHGFRFNKPLREFTENRMPPHFRNTPFDKVQNNLFVEDGLLGGEIIEKTMDRIFIKDFFDDRWEISFDQETKIQRKAELEAGDKIMIIGEKQGDFSFKALIIKKMEGCANCQMPRKFQHK